MRSALVCVSLSLLLLAGAACGGGDDEAEASPGAPQATNTASAAGPSATPSRTTTESSKSPSPATAAPETPAATATTVPGQPTLAPAATKAPGGVILPPTTVPPTAVPPTQPSVSSAPPFVEVSGAGTSWSPNNFALRVGGSIRWAWSGSGYHNVSGPGFSSGEATEQGSYSYAFAAPGRYRFVCDVHAQMFGFVTVE